MSELLSADVENRGLVLDPRTKLVIMLAIVFFALGGAGSDIRAIGPVVSVLSIFPIALLFTANQYKKAFVYGGLYALFYLADRFLLPQISGGAHIIGAMFCMFILRFMPGLIMGAYILSSTTVSEFIAAMNRMKMPPQITIPLSVMFRFFPTVTEEFSSINTAMKMRDIRFGGKNAGKMIEYRIIPLIVCSVNIGSELSAAALTRGLSPGRRRTNICRIGFHAADIFCFLLSAVPIVLLILGRAGVLQ